MQFSMKACMCYLFILFHLLCEKILYVRCVKYVFLYNLHNIDSLFMTWELYLPILRKMHNYVYGDTTVTLLRLAIFCPIFYISYVFYTFAVDQWPYMYSSTLK